MENELFRIKENIGNTPLIRLKKIEEKYNLHAHIYCKLESHNLTGSVKDRAVFYMIKDLIDKHDSVCSKIEELSRKNRVSPPIPQPKVYSRIEKKLLCTCVAIQTQESLFLAEDSFEEIKLASTIKRFFQHFSKPSLCSRRFR